MTQHNEEWIKIDQPAIEMIQTYLSEWLSHLPPLCPTGPSYLCKMETNDLEAVQEEVFQGTENDWSSGTDE
jgi:hypothetical protein